MSREKLINAFNLLAEAAAMVAIELEANEPAAARAAVQDSGPAAGSGAPSSPAPTSHAAVVDQGECPKHGRPWKAGNYGPYCTSKSDDPAWSNPRGYCKITPSNAPDWLRVNGLAA